MRFEGKWSLSRPRRGGGGNGGQTDLQADLRLTINGRQARLALAARAGRPVTSRHMRSIFRGLGLLGVLLLCQCGGPMGGGNMGGPTVEERKAAIATEPSGDFYYGRRYYVEKTRFWGYVRRPRQSWDKAKLVMIREDRKRQPDRLPENGPEGRRYAFDNNHEYRLKGYYTGKEAYDPNSNQFLPEFMLTDYEVVNRNPGWLFRPDDKYDAYRITLYPR
jgi:hypothetical protein